MPESFLKDKSVPARWRVLGVINGFILNRGCFYGSNDWLMEQLACTEPTISAAFAELEKLNLVRIERTARSRKVYRKENDPNELGSETQTEPAHDPSWLGPNSVSNSEKNTSEASLPQEKVYEDENTKKPRSAAKYPHSKEIFSWFPSREPSWDLNTTELKHAELLFLRGEKKVRSILVFCGKHKDDEFLPSWENPSQLERNWNKIIKFADRNGL